MLGRDRVNGQRAADALLEELGLGADLGAVEAPLGVHRLVGGDDGEDDRVAWRRRDRVGELVIEGLGLLVVLLGGSQLLDHAADVVDAPVERDFFVLAGISSLSKNRLVTKAKNSFFC